MSVSDLVAGGTLLDPADLSFLDPVSRLYATNPFRRRWDRHLREGLGPERLVDLADGSGLVWGPLGTAKDLLSEPLLQVLLAGPRPERSTTTSCSGTTSRGSTSARA
jgi:hypothetical protein